MVNERSVGYSFIHVSWDLRVILNEFKLTKIKKLHVSVSGKFGGSVCGVARHQIPSQTRVDIDERSDRLLGIRLALDPGSCGVVDAQDVDLLIIVNLRGSM
jgi:hypothetical protein